MPEVHVITLDLDNTLWDVDRTIIRAEQQMKDWLGEHAPEVLAIYKPELLGQIREQILSDATARRHDLTFMRIRVLTEVAKHAGLDATPAQTVAEQAFEVFFEGRNQVDFFPGALEMLRAVSSKYPIYSLTNGNANVEKTGIAQFLKGAYSSADLGRSKPDPEMFTQPLKEIGFDPANAVHIGDNLVDDVHGANQAGLASIWVNLNDTKLGKEDPTPHAEVTHLDDVHSAIEELASSDRSL